MKNQPQINAADYDRPGLVKMSIVTPNGSWLAAGDEVIYEASFAVKDFLNTPRA